MNKKSLPFAILGIINLFLLAFTFFLKKQKTLIVLINSIGIAYVFEYFVLNIFNMYRYYPNVFKNKRIDSVFGALLSQAVFVPIKATFLVLFHKGWKWRIGSSVGYGIIERLFICQGIFKNDSWRTIYTMICMPIYFYIVKKWWDKLQDKNAKVIPKVSVFFFYWVNYTNIYFFLLAFWKKYFFRIGFSKNRYWEHFIIVPIYTMLQSVIGAINTMSWKYKTKFIGFLILQLMDQLMYKLNIIRRTKGIWMFVPIHLFLLICGEFYKKIMRSCCEE